MSRFEALRSEFEESLRRPLTGKEKEFVHWVVCREKENRERDDRYITVKG